MAINTPYRLHLSITPALVNGEPYVAVRHIRTRQEQDLIRQLPRRNWNPKHQCWYFAKIKEFWTQFKMLCTQYDTQIESINPIVMLPVIQCLCFIL